MPTSLSFDQHLDALGRAGGRLAGLGGSVDETANVPTCPAWDMRALLAHQTMVHRWATAVVTGTDPDAVPNQTEIRETVDDLVPYFEQGLAGLVDALVEAPTDLEVMTFLKDPPDPRHFWARRQAHETTVHAIDGLAAELGRPPSLAEAGIDVEFALDGIDELLTGFFTRGPSKLFDGEEFSILVAPDDGDRRWMVQVAEQLTVSCDEAYMPAAATGDVPVTITGPAAAIYLGLWNRGNGFIVAGRPDLVERWRATQQVRWG